MHTFTGVHKGHTVVLNTVSGLESHTQFTVVAWKLHVAVCKIPEVHLFLFLPHIQTSVQHSPDISRPPLRSSQLSTGDIRQVDVWSKCLLGFTSAKWNSLILDCVWSTFNTIIWQITWLAVRFSFGEWDLPGCYIALIISYLWVTHPHRKTKIYWNLKISRESMDGITLIISYKECVCPLRTDWIYDVSWSIQGFPHNFSRWENLQNKAQDAQTMWSDCFQCNITLNLIFSWVHIVY